MTGIKTTAKNFKEEKSSSVCLMSRKEVKYYSLTWIPDRWDALSRTCHLVEVAFNPPNVPKVRM